MRKKSVLQITRTAMFIALLVAAQFATRPLGQFVTGSCVNFILVTACLLIGLHLAAAVAVISPLFAFLLIGVPAFPLLLPFMMAGNLSIIIAIHYIAGRPPEKINKKFIARACAAAPLGALIKFLVMYIGVVQIALSFIPDINQPQINAMAAVFSWPQLVTALIGSSLALSIAPTLSKALKSAERG
ncbi:MAG: hypothetical protein FWF03_06600 [Defluviitaleaceae bacterium]|nr:hypothetical protein [Defluviitaleaceae bacterium]